MSKTLKEIKVIVGNYTDKDGNQKNKYLTIGSIIDTVKGPMIKLDSLPIMKGSWDGWAYMSDPKPRDDGGVPNPHPQAKRPAANFDNMNDDFPF
jgi:hypothetical protein